MINLIVFFILQTITPQYTLDYAQQVAERLNGEGGISVAIESDNIDAFKFGVCTVRNRLDAGWNPTRVLDPYYAPDSPVTNPLYVLITYNILNRIDYFDCHEIYYMFSNSDLRYLRIPADVVQFSYQSKQREDFGLNYVNRYDVQW